MIELQSQLKYKCILAGYCYIITVESFNPKFTRTIISKPLELKRFSDYYHHLNLTLMTTTTLANVG